MAARFRLLWNIVKKTRLVCRCLMDDSCPEIYWGLPTSSNSLNLIFLGGNPRWFCSAVMTFLGCMMPTDDPIFSSFFSCVFKLPRESIEDYSLVNVDIAVGQVAIDGELSNCQHTWRPRSQRLKIRISDKGWHTISSDIVALCFGGSSIWSCFGATIYKSRNGVYWWAKWVFKQTMSNLFVLSFRGYLISTITAQFKECRKVVRPLRT